MKEITSRTNPRFKTWLSLTEARGIRQNQLCLVSGGKLVDEILRDSPGALEEFLLPPKVMPPSDLPVPATRLSAPLFKELDVIGTRLPIAVVRTPTVDNWIPKPAVGLELVLALSDPANLGGLVRSAAAFGVQRVILTEECASPFLPKSLRASAGSAFKMTFFRTGPLKAFESQGEVLGLDMEGEPLSSFNWPKDGRLILGEEGQGLPSSLGVRRIAIPMAPKIESLNATVAASIALYTYSRQFSG